jgi:hypothetical protein
MYVALTPLKVGTEDVEEDGVIVRKEIWRNPGEVVPEAESWSHTEAYVSTGRLTFIPDHIVATSARLDQMEAALAEMLVKVNELAIQVDQLGNRTQKKGTN